MKKISENLYVISKKGLFWVPIFVITNDNEKLTLVDTGTKKHAKIVIREIKEKWGSLDKIQRIVFTHRHYDHTQGLAPLIDEVKNAYPNHTIEIITHKNEGPHFAKDIKRADLQPNRLVEHEEMIDEALGIRAIHVPGHTFGHLCLLLEKEKIMLLGDVLIWIFGKIKQILEKVHDNWDQSQKSLKILLNYEWDIGIPSHMKLKQIPRAEIEKYISENKKKRGL